MPRERKRKKKSSGSVTVDMEGVQSRVLLPEGEYPLRVKEVELKETDEGNQYLAWTFETFDCDDEKLNGVPVYNNTSLKAKALWNLRTCLEALGVGVPDGPMDIEFDELIDEEMLGTITHEEYEGKTRTRLTEYAPLEERDEEKVKVKEESDDEEDDEPKTKKKGKGKKPPQISEDELADMDVDELEDVVNTYELDVDLDEFKTAKKKINAVKDALEEAGYLEE